MADFAKWFAEQSDSLDPNIKEIRALATQNPADWPAHRNDPAPYLDFLRLKADPAALERLINSFTRLFETWRRGNGLAGWFSGTNLLFLAGLVVGAAILWGIYFDDDFLNEIANPTHARGLITFLFAICTIAVVLIASVAVFFLDKDEIEARFSPAKDIITILIGVLGTILGFYFGTATGDDRDTDVVLTNVSVSDWTPELGKTVTMAATITEGIGPYRYDVEFTGDDVFEDPIDIEATDAENGMIAAEVAIPSTVREGTSFPVFLPFVVTVEDAEGSETKWSGSLQVVETDDDPAQPADATTGEQPAEE